MAPESPREQEQSIKARKREIFEEEQQLGPQRPFSAYLKSTPAMPMTGMQKGILGAVLALVVLLLLAAFATMPSPRSHPHPAAPKPAAGAAANH
jgi:hypothetical protein